MIQSGERRGHAESVLRTCCEGRTVRDSVRVQQCGRPSIEFESAAKRISGQISAFNPNVFEVAEHQGPHVLQRIFFPRKAGRIAAE
jgi:hypothetical protein